MGGLSVPPKEPSVMWRPGGCRPSTSCLLALVLPEAPDMMEEGEEECRVEREGVEACTRSTGCGKVFIEPGKHLCGKKTRTSKHPARPWPTRRAAPAGHGGHVSMTVGVTGASTPPAFSITSLSFFPLPSLPCRPQGPGRPVTGRVPGGTRAHKGCFPPGQRPSLRGDTHVPPGLEGATPHPWDLVPFRWNLTRHSRAGSVCLWSNKTLQDDSGNALRQVLRHQSCRQLSAQRPSGALPVYLTPFSTGRRVAAPSTRQLCHSYSSPPLQYSSHRQPRPGAPRLATASHQPLPGTSRPGRGETDELFDYSSWRLTILHNTATNLVTGTENINGMQRITNKGPRQGAVMRRNYLRDSALAPPDNTIGVPEAPDTAPPP